LRDRADHLEHKHRRREFTGGGIGDGGRGSFEDEQSRIGGLAREDFAVADREERVASCSPSVRQAQSSHSRKAALG
jgi:hypothetical protein